MQLLSASQIKAWDAYTIAQEPIVSLDLMERAAAVCTKWLLNHVSGELFFIFCGTGNNGGDGLAIARMLAALGRNVSVFILDNGIVNVASDFNTNLERLKAHGSVSLAYLKEEGDFPLVPEDAVIIEALWGTGLNRPLNGLAAALIIALNRFANCRVAVDMPGGMFADRSSKNSVIFRADYTLTFQQWKLALLLPENEKYFGSVQVLDIGLHPGYLSALETRFELVDKNFIRSLYRPRRAFAHKGDFGHVLVMAGGYGKMGAAVLCTRAALRTGAGLVSVHVPRKGVDVLQVSTPEAMCRADLHDERITNLDYELTTFGALGIGPGIGRAQDTAACLYDVLKRYTGPLVLDADALNILSENPAWLSALPAQAILTPHPKEFQRLFGRSDNDFDRIALALEQAARLSVVIVLKGHRTFVATPSGKGFFNTTGNAGMAKGGSGDVLTGMITALLAQGYAASAAAVMGVYLHGAAGDSAMLRQGIQAMLAGDIIESIGAAFAHITDQ